MEKPQRSAPGTAFDMLYLCGCALNAAVPSSARVAALDFEGLYALSAAHSVTALVAEALTGRRDALPSDDRFCAAILAAKERSVRKSLMFGMERDKLSAYFEANGIWYLPLKGTVLQGLYPKPWLRQMVDNDILFDAAHRAQVRDWFVSCGYDIYVYDVGKHDIYQKAPFYNFEMHVDLFGGADVAGLGAYYATVKERLVPAAAGSSRLRFTDEDLYCYVLAHAYSHKQEAGLGIRFLCDLWVLLRAYGDKLDWDYIRAELAVLGMAAFEQESRALADAVFSNVDSFSPEKLSGELLRQLTLALESGTHGTTKQQVEKSIAHRGGKLRYFFSCIFPAKQTLWRSFPPCRRHGWLLPVGWAWRLLTLVFKNTGFVLYKLKCVFFTDTDA